LGAGERPAEDCANPALQSSAGAASSGADAAASVLGALQDRKSKLLFATSREWCCVAQRIFRDAREQEWAQIAGVERKAYYRN
jgi:hypothetical protein